jgi:hypothetical protein
MCRLRFQCFRMMARNRRRRWPSIRSRAVRFSWQTAKCVRSADPVLHERVNRQHLG